MEFVVAIVALIVGGRLVGNWMRMRNGFEPLDPRDAASEGRPLRRSREVALLSTENSDLKGKIVRLEERVAVLERIATDRTTDLSAQIEALR
jgi:hypothetical protein